MRWRKLGLVYRPRGDRWWARTHAYLPTAEVLDGDVIRVYFASLDENKYGRIGYVDLDTRDPTRILYETEKPVLDIGEPGTFDDSGVNPSCVLAVGGKKYLYYIGWQRCERVPYMLFTGLAVFQEGGGLTRAFSVPVLERTQEEPFLRSAVTILGDGSVYSAWYVSGIGWTETGSRLVPAYVIRHAESKDGIVWKSNGHICIAPRNSDEFGFGRPWVVRDGQIYKMWYSIRSRVSPYTIGYAESADGIYWERLDHEAGIARSESGWDSEMICFPCVIDAGGRRYMFYNGNRHGLEGFGCAVLES
ncbi:MAG: hypothetical protein QW815_02715 [Nitrososphaerota archaeon]